MFANPSESVPKTSWKKNTRLLINKGNHDAKKFAARSRVFYCTPKNRGGCHKEIAAHDDIIIVIRDPVIINNTTPPLSKPIRMEMVRDEKYLNIRFEFAVRCFSCLIMSF